MNFPRIAVTATTGERETEAKQLATRLALPFVTQPDGYDFLLVYTLAYLGLQKTNTPRMKPLYIDFHSGKLAYRRAHTSKRQELLARALGVKASDHPRIVDATAGLGRDSFILACLGYQVTMLERSAIVHALLQDALQRASHDVILAPIVARLALIHTDACDWLENEQNQGPDVIYLDPMFPDRQKSSSVKKEMLILQELLIKDDNSQKLLKIARACAKQRVVVKRPLTSPNFGEIAANYSLNGKTCRFDVYLPLNQQGE